ncbi:hypothetical protein Dimus_023229 [Dionaea muscipula]
MAGKRGRPRKIQVMQRDSIVTLRGKQVQGEQTLDNDKKGSGSASKGCEKMDELMAGGDAEGSRSAGQWGDDCEILEVAARKLESEGPRQDDPRSMVGNRDRQNGLLLTYEEHVGEDLEITDEDIAPELVFWQEAIIGYVLCDLVSFSAMESFFHWQWAGISMPYC